MAFLCFAAARIGSGQIGTRGQTPYNPDAKPLTKSGEEILKLMEDAYSCLPISKADQLADRMRILLSDLLQCVDHRQAEDIASAAWEFNVRNGDAHTLFWLLEPLVYRHQAARVDDELIPWHIEHGKLILNARSEPGFHIGAGSTGPGYRFRLLGPPLRAWTRTDIRPFRQQIVKESSHWHNRPGSN
jgi:hypothetical protein